MIAEGSIEMTHYKDPLPQLSDRLFITDGGLETTLVFRDGFELPCFAAFDPLKDEAGYRHLRSYFEDYLRRARRHGLVRVPENTTWRASADRGGAATRVSLAAAHPSPARQCLLQEPC
jgi:S-methylmethionine-dependent homocysteine/selenocysteine methylase